MNKNAQHTWMNDIAAAKEARAAIIHAITGHEIALNVKGLDASMRKFHELKIRNLKFELCAK